MSDKNEQDLVTLIEAAQKGGYQLNTIDEEEIRNMARRGRAIALMEKESRWFKHQLHFFRCNHAYALMYYEETPSQKGEWRVYQTRQRLGVANA